MHNQLQNEMGINKRHFLAPAIALFVFMVSTYILTLVIPHGQMERNVVEGVTKVSLESYRPVSEGISFIQFILSPLLVFQGKNALMLTMLIIFLIVIGGSFNLLHVSGVLNYILKRIAFKFKSRRKLLLALITLFFLSFGTFLSAFEECIPMVPFAVAVALAMGWDTYTGLIMSLFATGCGFSNGAFNPFTTGTMQAIMGLPIFSGLSMRMVTFVISYIVIMFFLLVHVNRLEKKNVLNGQNAENLHFEKDSSKERAMYFFIALFCVFLSFAVASAFLRILQDYLAVILIPMFLFIGIGCALLSNMRKEIMKYFLRGVAMFLPGIALVVVSAGIQFIMEKGNILDTILYYFVHSVMHMPKSLAIIGIFVIVLLIDFFIPSGTAEALILGPILLPLAGNLGISRQLVTLAFNYGDGFSNLIYITNVGLLVALSLTGYSYGKWIKKSWPLHLSILAMSAVLLLVGLQIGY